MADETKTNENVATENLETNTSGKETEASQQIPSIEELMTKLKQAQADMLRNKNAMDKVMSENKNLKDQLRQRMTADEQASEAKREAEEQQKQYVSNLESRLKMIEAVSRYTDMGMDSELAKATAEADLNGDKDTVTANIRKWTESLVKAKEAEWLKTRPVPQTGGTSELSKEQFDKMTLAQKSELYESDPETYHRLLGK